MSREMDDIYAGLHSGLKAAASLSTWVRGQEAWEQVKHFQQSCEEGIKAYDRLRAQLRDGKKHIECERSEPPTSCYCNATSHPPCGFCEKQPTPS